MKNITNILLSVVVVGFVGCGSTGSTDEVLDDEDGSYQGSQSVMPQELTPEGIPVAYKDYLFPYNTLVDKGITTQNIYVYTKDADGNLRQGDNFSERFVYNEDAQDNPVIEVFNKLINDSQYQLDQTNVIYANYNRITSSEVIQSGGFINTDYPLEVSKNSKILDVTENGVKMVCIVENIVPGFQDLSSLIPVDMINTMTGNNPANDQFNYVNTLHKYCGTTEGTTIDSYNVSAWGEVLKIINYSDNTARYEILDKKSIQYPSF